MSQKISLDAENFERIISLHLNYKWLNFQKKGLIELWSLAESEDDKELIEFLIKKFEYINTDRINEACLRFVEQIENRWNFSSQNTIVTAICDNANPDGSQHLVQCMKNKFSYNKGWKENNFSNSIAVTARELITPDINIVLVDDFVGTGYTLFRKYNWLLNQIKKIGGWYGTIKTISLASMEFAKENIAQLNSDHFSYLWLKKGISEHAPFDDRERFAVSMTLLEAKLKGKINKTKLPCFGFKSSESLYIYENYNIPNNVFPIFWWPELLDGTIRSTIFKRIF